MNMLLTKFLPALIFRKIFGAIRLYHLRLKINQPLRKESADPKGGLVYEDLMSFYKKLMNSYKLPVEELIGGSIKKADASLLYNLVIQEKPKIVLQVGTFVGFSTLIIAEALKHSGDGRIYTVDPEISHRKISNPVDIARNACKERGLSDRVEFIKGWFSNVPYWSDKKISGEVVGPALLHQLKTLDFVFIDGDHSIMSTISDFALVASSLGINGICVMHDVCSHNSVSRAITAILSDKTIKRMFNFSLQDSHDGLAVFRKIREYVAVRICIKDKITQKPVSDVILCNKNYGQKIISDCKGEIYIPSILADKYYLDIMAKGYKSLKNYCVTLDSHRQFQEVTIEVNEEK